MKQRLKSSLLYFNIIMIMVLVLTMLFLNTPLVHATSFTPSVLSSWNVDSPLDTTVEDSAYATINAQGWVILDLGSTYGNITQIDIKVAWTGSNDRLDVSVSKDDVTWFLVCNDFYRNDISLVWYHFPIGYDCKAIRYIKLQNVASSSSYIHIDDVHFTDTPKIYLKNGYYYPRIKVSSTTTIIECLTGNIGYYHHPVGFTGYLVPKMAYANEFIDFDMGLRLNATSIYINATAANLHVLYSSNLVSWFDLGDNSGSNHNYTLSNVEVRYVRVLVANTSEVLLRNIAVKGIMISETYVPPYVPVPDFFSFTFGTVPILVLAFIMGVPALTIYKFSHSGTGALLGAFIGIILGVYYSVLSIWFLIVGVIAVVFFFIFIRNSGGNEE